MKFLLIMIFSLLLHAQQSIQVNSTLHYENEKINGKQVYIDAHHGDFRDDVLGDDEQSLATFFNIFSYKYTQDNDILSVNLEVRANIKLSKEDYQTPFYIDKYNYQDINEAMLNVASVDINTQYASVSLGRNPLEMPWLNGSVDGILAYYQNDYFQVKTLWFYNYYDFQVNYYSKFEKINDEKGVYAIHAQSGNIFKDFELTLHSYLLPSSRSIYGFNIDIYPSDSLVLSSSFNFSDTLGDEGEDESYIRVKLEYYLDDNHAFFLGHSQTGDNGLDYMLQFGSQPFSAFYLSNEIQREKASNNYINYSYLNDDYFFDIIYGQTQYYERNNHLNSSELDIFIEYSINENLKVNLSYMYKDVDTKDTLSLDQSLVMSNLVMSW